MNFFSNTSDGQIKPNFVTTCNKGYEYYFFIAPNSEKLDFFIDNALTFENESSYFCGLPLYMEGKPKHINDIKTFTRLNVPFNAFNGLLNCECVFIVQNKEPYNKEQY